MARWQDAFGVKRTPPMHPGRFKRELTTRTFADPGDAEFVAGLYRKMFER